MQDLNPKFEEHYKIFKNSDYDSEASIAARIAMSKTAVSEEEWKIVKEAARPGGELERVADNKLHTQF